MSKLSYVFFDSHDKEILNLEELRCEVFETEGTSYYLDLIYKERMLAIGGYLDDKLVGGVYVTDSFDSLFIEQVFVKKEFQNNSLHIGSSLLKYILENKKIIEKFFHKEFNRCRLESRNKDSFYKMLGFREENNIIGTMKRRI